jgi:hypothetical protein
MNDSIGIDVGYGALALDTPPLSPEPDQRDAESLTIRAPAAVLRRARAAAEAESRALELQNRPGKVTLNGVLVHALKHFFAAYEKEHGTLPEPTPSPKKKRAKGAKVEHAPEIERYAASIAKKRQAKEN